MDFCFFIPIIFGCPNKIKQDDDHTPYLCPKCHNPQLVKARSRTWFELCWIPLIPMKKHAIYICGICQFRADQDKFQPQPAGGGGGHFHSGGYPQQPYMPQGGGYPPKA